jgi:hypothetical protein
MIDCDSFYYVSTRREGRVDSFCGVLMNGPKSECNILEAIEQNCKLLNWLEKIVGLHFIADEGETAFEWRDTGYIHINPPLSKESPQ